MPPFCLPVSSILQLSRTAFVSAQALHSRKVFGYFSGIQPTGELHLGNYIGAVLQWLRLQDDDTFQNRLLSIVDLHAITLPQDPSNLRQSIQNMTAALVSCGIDTRKISLFQQSHVQEHTYLSWILGTLCTVPQIKSLPHWQDKSRQMANFPAGLFLYPVLQAADILLYRSTHVPVGEDQTPHLQFCRDLALKFNNRFEKDFFPVPEMLTGPVAKVKDLRHPEIKMSKSNPSPKGTINLLDSTDAIHMKIGKAVTDFESRITYDPENRPGVANLISIFSALTNRTPEEIVRESAELDKVRFKEKVASEIDRVFRPIRDEYRHLTADPEHVQRILDDGAARVRPMAEETVRNVRRCVGLL